jgi:hypothetical protein
MATDISIVVEPQEISTSVVLNIGPAGATGPAGANGQNGANGSDASVTSSNITAALGYTPDSPTAPRPPSAHSHEYSTLTGRPTIPAAQVNSDWNATSGLAEILNKPTIQTFDQSLNTTDNPTFGDINANGNINANGDLNANGVSLYDQLYWGGIGGTLYGRHHGILYYDGSADFANGAASIDASGNAAFAGLTVGGSPVVSPVNADWNATSGLAEILNKPTTFAPSAHASSHASGGSDPISLAGAQITSGTLADARLSANVPLLASANSFTAGQTITAAANTSALTASYSVTGANTTPLFNLSGTWNTTGIARGLLLNVTDTASNTSSLLVDLQANGATVFGINKTGLFTKDIAMAGAGIFSSAFFRTRSDGSYSFSSSSNPNGANDLFLCRDAANTLAQRNGTNAQTFRLYGTFTDASNGRRLDITSTTGGIFTLTATGNGTGASGNLLKLTQPILLPASSVTLATNGDLAFEATSNTSLTIRYRGSDGTTRSVALTLA